jgi:hypothetical protein
LFDLLLSRALSALDLKSLKRVTTKDIDSQHYIKRVAQSLKLEPITDKYKPPISDWQQLQSTQVLYVQKAKPILEKINEIELYSDFLKDIQAGKYKEYL